MDKNALKLMHLTFHIRRWIGNMTAAAIFGIDLSKEKLETDPEVIRDHLQAQVNPKTCPPMAPELIQDNLQALANPQTCPPDVLNSAKIILDWIDIAQKVLSGSFGETDIETLIAHGIRGDTTGYLAPTVLLEEFNILILIKIERYKEAIEIIDRLFASDVLISGGCMPLSLSRSILHPNILLKLKKETLLHAIDLSSQMDPIFKPTQFRKTLQQQLDKL